MRRIRTSEAYALIVCTLIAAAFGVGSAMAADDGPKVTVVYDHALPNVPGKSIKGILVEYGPGVATGPTSIPNLLSPTQPFSKERSEPRSMMGRRWFKKPERTSLRCLVIDIVLMRMRAKPNLPRCWP